MAIDKATKIKELEKRLLQLKSSHNKESRKLRTHTLILLGQQYLKEKKLAWDSPEIKHWIKLQKQANKDIKDKTK